MTDWLDPTEVAKERTNLLVVAVQCKVTQEDFEEHAGRYVLKAIAELPEPAKCEDSFCNNNGPKVCEFTAYHRIWRVAKVVTGRGESASS